MESLSLLLTRFLAVVAATSFAAACLAEGVAASGSFFEDSHVLQAGNLEITIGEKPEGITLLSIRDLRSGVSFVLEKDAPLFTLVLRNTQTKEQLSISSQQGWRQREVRPLSGPSSFWQIQLAEPNEERLAGISVTMIALPQPAAHSVTWKLKVENASRAWSLWEVRFPQVNLASFAEDAWFVYPYAAGIAEQKVWERDFHFGGRYPSGWVTMQLLAAYSESLRSGLYIGVHDPYGSTKEFQCRSKPAEKTLALEIHHPVPNMSKVGNSFELPGSVVWRAFQGDWFDAATIYRDWVGREARWFPQLTAEGREDTPLWMRELPLWILGGGAPSECVDRVLEFAKYFQCPCGFHWYNWHQIPFDNDYPHYFPTKPGFPEAVKRLQDSGVQVMPYINGRLWDTRDRGLEDYQFTPVARPAVSKDENGEPYTETYNSKESDGSPVRLGVMCPTTSCWHEKVGGIVDQLFKECGVHGVYIDQVAAAPPTLCFDLSHGHPLGGGHWWNEGYWKLLEEIRRRKPDHAMITTECNAEPFIRWFDGYLTWHWQYDRQIPLFPAVYGGTVQMFGRWYGSTGSGLLPSVEASANRDRATRMRIGQSLAFGEQLGWINPGIIQETENAQFLRAAAGIRWQLRRYFYAGQMIRPPKLSGEIPQIKADWQWHGTRWVTTDAVLTGAWAIPADRSVAVIAVNVSDQPLSAELNTDLVGTALQAQSIHVRPLHAGEAPSTTQVQDRWNKAIHLPPLSVLAWELRIAP